MTAPFGTQSTLEAWIAACDCGSTQFKTGQSTRTTTTLICARCGLRTSHKSAVAAVRLPAAEVAYALEHTLTRPAPPSEEPVKEDPSPLATDAAPASPPAPVEEYTTLRFRVARAAKEAVIDRGLEICRIMHLQESGWRDQTWHGLALEYVFADWIAGAPPAAIAVLDAMEAAVADATAALGTGALLPARRRRDLWAATRDQQAQQHGFLAARPLAVPSARLPALVPSPAPAAPADCLHDPSLVELLRTYIAEQMREAEDRGDPPLHYVVGGAELVPSIRQRVAQYGGYALRIEGDPRMRTRSGMPPIAYVYLSEVDVLQDFILTYQDRLALSDAAVTVEEV
jgi:hypothetical protein